MSRNHYYNEQKNGNGLPVRSCSCTIGILAEKSQRPCEECVPREHHTQGKLNHK